MEVAVSDMHIKGKHPHLSKPIFRLNWFTVYIRGEDFEINLVNISLICIVSSKISKTHYYVSAKLENWSNDFKEDFLKIYDDR